MANNNFKQFNINKILIDKLSAKNINDPTKIQLEVIPKVLLHEDVIAQSKTGTGKTIAYLLPLITLIIKEKIKVLIIAPTNELANQIYEEIIYYTKDLSISHILLTGGKPIIKQVNELKNDFDIAVGVPGRILKLAEDGNLKLSLIKKIVLDEADFLIDLGFLEDIRKVFDCSKNLDQMMIFSATLSSKTKKVIDIINNQRYAVRIDPKNRLPENIANYFFVINDDAERIKVLFRILDSINPYLCIIFVRTKEDSVWLYRMLKNKKIAVSCLNGSLTPAQRKRAIDEFKKAKTQYLVATDLASRGLDVESITHIINYNLPVNELDYLHRAGRTARMNETGVVYTICNVLDEGYLKKYAANLDFKLEPAKFTNSKIVIDERYKGVKPRYNIGELKKIEKLKRKEKPKYAGKKKRR